MSGILTSATVTRLIRDATTAGRSMITAADAAAQRTLLELGALALLDTNELTLVERQIVFLSSPAADATAATGVVEFNLPFAISLTSVKFECDSDNPPTGAAAQMDLLLNGTTVFSTNPTIDAGESSSDTAATAPVLSSSPTAISAGGNLEFDLDQVGASDAGQGYYAVLYYTRTNS